MLYVSIEKYRKRSCPSVSSSHTTPPSGPQAYEAAANAVLFSKKDVGHQQQRHRPVRGRVAQLIGLVPQGLSQHAQERGRQRPVVSAAFPIHARLRVPL